MSLFSIQVPSGKLEHPWAGQHGYGSENLITESEAETAVSLPMVLTLIFNRPHLELFKNIENELFSYSPKNNFSLL